MLKQELWMIPVAYWVGLISILVGLGLVAGGIVSAWWLLAWFIGHNICAMATSVGLHRYFSHGTFQTNKFWHVTLAYLSTLLFQGSPYGWATAHITHHVYSDTKRDPHYSELPYLWNKKYRDVPMLKRRLRHLINDKVLKAVHRYSVLIALVTCGVLVLISWKLLLFGYLMALGTAHLVGAIHQITSHKGGGPRNLPMMEWIAPAFGEWNHKFHHDHPKEYRFGPFDPGAKFIDWIKK